jgi:signal transduction histidine kinase
VLVRAGLPLLAIALAAAVAFGVLARAQLIDAARGAAMTDLEIEERLLTRDAAATGGVSAIDTLIFRQEQLAETGDRMLFIVRRRPSGVQVAGNMAQWPAAARFDAAGRGELTDGAGKTLAIRRFTLGRGFEVVLARHVSVRSTLDGLLPWFAALLTLALAAMGGWLLLVAHRVRHDVGQIEHVLTAAAGGAMTARVDTAVLRYGEFGRVGHDINAMLERLDSAMLGLKDISGHISHELAMPFGRLTRHARELMSRHPELQDEIAPIAEEVEAMRDQFTALLEIYELEAGADLAFECVAIEQVVAEALELYSEAAAAEGIALDIAIESHDVRLSYWQMVRALANVIDNALRFSPPTGTIRIVGERRAEDYCLTVHDDGPGVGGRDLAGLLAGLRRGEFGKDTTNRGLGLRLVKATCLRQGISFAIDDKRGKGGTAACFTFPGALSCGVS